MSLFSRRDQSKYLTINLKPGQASNQMRADLRIPLIFAAIKFLIHAFVNFNGGYGYFRDELYYIACTEHMDFGYVDHPPLSIWILSVSRLIFGDSLFALRLLPALCGAATVFFVGAIARRLGGGRMAETLSCLGSIVSLVYLGMNSVYSMNSFDILFWTLAAYVTILLVQTLDAKYWLVLGVLFGLAALNKIGILWLAGGIYLGFAFSRQRYWILSTMPWLAAAIAAALFLPYVIWNMLHDFPHLEFIRNATSLKYSSQSPLTFLTGQVLLQNPVTLPLWLAGLAYLFFSSNSRRLRILGIAYITVLLILLINGHSKPEYLSPAYGMLFAAGGVAIEKFVERRKLNWLGTAYAAVLICGLALAPASTPILPVETYMSYAKSLGIEPTTAEGKELAKLPQFYADMFGWEQKVIALAKVFDQLPAEDQARCAIYSDNYGRCAAIDFFGKKYGLPRAIGSHNNYWLWGTGNTPGDVVIILGGEEKDHKRVFWDVRARNIVKSDLSMPYENNLRIYVCRKPKIGLSQAWRQIKHFI